MSPLGDQVRFALANDAVTRPLAPEIADTELPVVGILGTAHGREVTWNNALGFGLNIYAVQVDFNRVDPIAGRVEFVVEPFHVKTLPAGSLSMSTADIQAQLVLNWSPSPFTEVDAINRDDRRLNVAIAAIRDLDTISSAQQVADRLTYLSALYKEETGGYPMSWQSVSAFESFLRAQPNLMAPVLTATPQGDIYARWASSKDKVLSVHFVSAGEARFVVFKPNPRHGSRIIRMTGSATVDTLMETVEPHGVLSWAAL